MTDKNDDGSQEAEHAIEYGIQFPDGSYQWGNSAPGVLPLGVSVNLALSAGRGVARDTYRDRLRGTGIDPDAFALKFVTRKRVVTYTEPEEIVERAPLPPAEPFDDETVDLDNL